MAGLLTHPNPLRLLETYGSLNDIVQQTLVQDLQQRVLSRILTGFPFKSPETHLFVMTDAISQTHS